MGFISRWDIGDPSAMSGMPAAAWAALGAQGIELIHLRPEPEQRPTARRRLRALVPSRTRRPLRALASGIASTWQRARVPWRSQMDFQRTLAGARRRAGSVAAQLTGLDLDALFGICISSDIFELETILPIVYASDATACLVNATYPRYARRSAGYQRACDQIERASLQAISAGLFPSRVTRESAIHDYGVDPKRCFLVPLGANVTPQDLPPTRAPRPDQIELLLVAADPERKRLDLCIDVVEELARRGLHAKLNYVGPETPRAVASPLVHCAGSLRLSSASDRAAHEQLLQRSHLMLLPSLGEMYGIAPCEAAHFGRPSIVSDAGGLPTVVEHGRTGIVLPVEASAAEYAHEVETLCQDSRRYTRLSEAALTRAREVLSWDVWGRTAASILRSTVAREAGRRCA